MTSDRFGPWKWVDSKRCYLWEGTSKRGGGVCKCRGFRAKEATDSAALAIEEEAGG